MAIETLTEVLETLNSRGYELDLIAHGQQLRAIETREVYEIDQLEIVGTYRFEGDTDPADMAITFALATHDGKPIGTYTVPYGVEMSPEDVYIVRRLEDRRPDNPRHNPSSAPNGHAD